MQLILLLLDVGVVEHIGRAIDEMPVEITIVSALSAGPFAVTGSDSGS
jgi:hypothetical protein